MTHEYRATVAWKRAGATYTDNKYSRAHQWHFDGGAVVPASASPQIVRVPMSDPAGVDPEEAFVAALSSCHMLFFLAYAARQGFVVDSYEDEAVGVMGKNPQGREAMVRVSLRPRIAWGGEKKPSGFDVQALHDQSHHDCYLANSVTTEVRVESR